VTRYGSDVVVDLLIEAGIEHVALNPGASFRGIHDSIVHSGGAPDLALCLHEAIAVTVAQGYAKAAGKPMAALLHNVVGLQNATMAIYNAWCDRAPMMLLGGTGPKSKAHRRPWIDWIHTAATQGDLVRDFTKWDDEPHDVESIPESFARALKTTISEPPGPVYLCYDVGLQEDELPADHVAESLANYPRSASPPAPRAAEIAEMAQALDAAERPVIVAGHVESAAELAEKLGAPVVDTGVRFALPTTHPLNATGVLPEVIDEADVVLSLDCDDLALHLRGNTPTILHAGTGHLKLRGWSHDYQPLARAAVHVTAGADETVKALLQAVSPRGGSDVRDRIAAARADWRAKAAAAEGDGVVPLERLVHEVGVALAGRDFVLANGTNARLELRTWDMDKPAQYLGWHSGGGLGYGVGAAIGAALANGPGTISVDVQADGDLLFQPQALWTAAHLSLPVLIVVFDNRQYGNTVEHATGIARSRGRGDERRYRGAGLADPATDLATLARSFGIWSAGPIADAGTLADRLAEAVDVAASGKPALLDVLTPGF
jgi:thiamine pyrophosphate-dependent acetolactate synthase large subunit-like protein